MTIKRGWFVKEEKIIPFRHPDVCDWDDVVRSGLGVPSDATDADFDDYHQGLAEVIPLKPRHGTNKQTN